ncbi:hypothetical protein MBLNU230_g8330t1 [Neophaeotheca triangularis]
MPLTREAGGGVKLDGSGPGTASEAEQSVHESELSSTISLGTRIARTESEPGSGSDLDEDEDGGSRDSNKFRMPEPGKTRLHLRTKEPLSPSASFAPRSPRGGQGGSPTTPGSARRGSAGIGSPLKAGGSPGQRRGGGGWSSSENVGIDAELVSSGLSRQGSIYSLGRVSFTGQLSQLTSMRLPDASTMAKRIASIPTSTEAAKVLSDSAEQIRMWIRKASELLSGLDAEDDVEWAAAGGREGIEEVDKAIQRFERLIQVYIVSIEELQIRPDVTQLSADELTGSVRQMEGIITSWKKIKQSLKGVKVNVEIAMEWEELWNTVLGEIAQEMEGLNRLVFEMEEKRYQGAESLLNGRDSIDLNELETIVEDHPGRGKRPASNRFSFPSAFSTSSSVQPPSSDDETEQSSLLALFARLQPLRASLDFLPMRLSVFHCRGNPVFPTACLELEERRDRLEVVWKKLEADAEALRRELGEDRWILVFRNAGRQALKMCDSVARSFGKLKDAVDCGEQTFNYLAFSKKNENYEAKKTHYGPAIERVLAIIDRGVMDRLTVNGEILRLQSDMKRRWTALKGEMRDMDRVLEEVNIPASRDKQLRDSVSTVMSSERSVGSSIVETPTTSPASSIVGPSGKNSIQGSRTPTPLINTRTRQPSFTPASGSRPSTGSSRLPSTGSSIPRHTHLARPDLCSSPSPSPATTNCHTPPANSSKQPTPPSRPRWQNTPKSSLRDFAPLSAYEPSPYAKTSIAKKTPTLTLQRSRTPTIPAVATTHSSPCMARNFTSPAQLSRPPSTLPSGRKSSLPVPSPLAPRTVSAAGAPGLRSSSALARGRDVDGKAVRRNSLLPVPVPMPVADGDEADIDEAGTGAGLMGGQGGSGRRASGVRAGSGLGRRGEGCFVGEEAGLPKVASAGRMSSLLPVTRGAGSRLGFEGKGVEDAGVGAGRPRWR